MKAKNESMIKKRSALTANLKRNWTLYTMVLPGVILILVFSYIPMYGIVMAFQRFKPALGFFRSPWAEPWYRYFRQLINDPYFPRLFRNTLILGTGSFLVGFPAPIILALLLNELRFPRFKKVTQTISYMPHFLSTVIVVGLMKLLFSTNGPMAQVMAEFGRTWENPFNLMGAFRPMYILSGIWQGVGYSSIIYLAAIAGIDPTLYEAARIDGANKWQQTRHVTLPGILPTVVILLIFNVRGIIGADTQKIMLMYQANIYEVADVIGTYTYRAGLENNQQSYATAVSLFMTVISFVILCITNAIAKRVNETSLW